MKIRNYIRIYAIIAALLLMPLSTLAIEDIEKGATLSVNDCIEIAIKNSPEVEIYKDYIDLQSARVGQSKASYFPSIGASGGYDFTNSENRYRTSNNKNFSAQVYLKFRKSIFTNKNAKI